MRLEELRRTATAAVLFLLTAAGAHAAITGTVFQDFNADGVRNTTSSPANPAIDTGVAGVTVTAFDAAGAPAGTTTTCGTTVSGVCTGSNVGFYSLTVAGAGPFRVELTGLPPLFSPAPRGAGSGTGVQFVPGPNATNVDFGLHRGAAFCQANPDVVTVCYVGGNVLTGPNAANPVIVNFRYSGGNSSPALVTGAGGHDDSGYGVGVHTIAVPASQVGSTFGVARRRHPATTFVAAYLKSFMSFGPGESTGAIFQLTGAATASVFLDLNAQFPSVPPAAGNNPHPVATTNFTNNSDEAISGPLVGKVSLGDIEVSEDDTTLYAVNLFDRRLYRIPIDAPATATRFDIPTGACADPNDARPFALAEDAGLIYVGLVCSAESSGLAADLLAAVYSFNPGTNTFSGSPVFTFPLNYPRGCANGDPNFPVSGTCGATSLAAWQAWQNNPSATPSVPQPMLTDIVFDHGDMILGLRDRYGDQSVGLIRTAGEVLRACRAGAGWTLESNGSCGGIATAGDDNGQGPGPGPGPATGFGEYYFEDAYSQFHAELSMGTLLQVPGFPDVVVTMFDPVFSGAGTTFDGGTRWLRNTVTDGSFGPGEFTRIYRIYNDSGDFGPGDPFFGKANGLGDLEALCGVAPLQIGNRIWMDTDSDGVQDPGEMPLAGVTLLLYDDSGTQIGSTVTDANGEWYFNFLVGASDPDTGDADVISPDPFGSQVFVVVDPAELAPGGSLDGKALTPANADPSTNGDERDSDAGMVNVPGGVGSRVGIQVTLGEPGENDHSLDFGFSAGALPTDFGDLPDNVGGSPDYPTLLASGGASHGIVPGLFMGASVDAETDGQPNAGATGDDTALVPDDEDGVIASDLNLTAGAAAQIRVNATNTTGSPALLCGFVDFNADGDFADPGEAAQTAVPNGSNNVQFMLPFTVPVGAAPSTYTRFRLSTGATCSPSGAAPDGEVEDYPVAIAGITPTDFGDLPDNVGGSPDYPTLLASGGASHGIVQGLFLGASVDAETDGQPNAGASGDDTALTPDDEDGVVASDLNLTVGAAAQIRVNATNTTGSPALLCGFVDFNADGDFADPGEAAQTAVPNGSSNVQFTLPFTAPVGAAPSTYARFRLSTGATCSPSGAAPNGEVEDYPVAIAAGGPPPSIPTLDTVGLTFLMLVLAFVALRALKARSQAS